MLKRSTNYRDQIKIIYDWTESSRNILSKVNGDFTVQVLAKKHVIHKVSQLLHFKLINHYQYVIHEYIYIYI